MYSCTHAPGSYLVTHDPGDLRSMSLFNRAMVQDALMAMRGLLLLIALALLPAAALAEEAQNAVDHQRRGEIIWTAGASEAIQEAFTRNQLLLDDDQEASCEERPLSARLFHNAGFGSKLHSHIASLLLALSINRTLASPGWVGVGYFPHRVSVMTESREGGGGYL